MKRAHEIKNAAASKFNCKPSEIVFSICLEMAWGEKNMERYSFTTEKGAKIEIRVEDGLFNMDVNGTWVGVRGCENGFFNIVFDGKACKCPSDSKSEAIYKNAKATHAKKIAAFEAKQAAIKETLNNSNATRLCPHCGTYCQGDCKAN